MRHRHGRTTTTPATSVPARAILAAALGAALAGAGSAAAQPASSGSAIVEEVLKDAAQEQTRDSDRVRRMVDEAVKGAEHAPSGEETVNPAAPEALRPVEGDPPGVLPAGFRAEDLRDRPVRDGTGAQIGTLRGLALDEASGLAKVMVEFAPLFGKPGKVSAIEVERLTPAADLGDGYVVEVTPVDYEALPVYAWAAGEWRRRDA